MESTKVLFCLVLLTLCVAKVLAATPNITGLTFRTVFLDENSAEDTLVTPIIANDPDSEGADFEITDVSGEDYFKLVRLSSFATEVRVKNPPDRETIALYRIGVNVSSASTSATGNSITIQVILRDENDNSPQFRTLAGLSNSIQLSEFSVAGAFVYVFFATDPDAGLNKLVRYSITQPNDGTFAIGELSGVTTVGNSVDPDDSPYSLCVTARDEGVPSLSNESCITIIVMDELDFPPEFTQSDYAVTIAEGNYTDGLRDLGLSILARDTSDFSATILYEIVITGAQTDNDFQIEDMATNTGTDIRVTGILDYEVSTRIVFNIQATKVNSSRHATSHSNYAAVIVTLTDVNDNNPMFTADIYHVFIPESDPNGAYVFAEVMAVDPDEGTNAEFEYTLQLGAPCDLISIDRSNGALRVCDTAMLDYETSITHDVMILAKETDVQPATDRRTGTATVTISVVNSNDNSPVFTYPEYTFNVLEEQIAMQINTTSPIVLSAVEAVDGDRGVFGAINYTITGIGAGTSFEIDETTAILSTIGSLNREAVSQYYLNLIASDGGEISNRAFTTLVINVEDINDNNPVFNPTEYVATLTEHVDYPSFIVLTATDEDDGTNGNIVYSVDHSSNFSVGSTGSIAAFNLDHETSQTIRLKVTATDGGSPAREGYAYVNITILAVNEQEPIFTGLPYVATILESQDVGAAIAGLVASASDPIEGHTVIYSIDPASVDGAAFSINSSSGQVRLARALDYENSADRTLTFTVVAADNGSPSLSSQVSVIVNVLDVNDNTPVITNPPDHDGFTYTFQEAMHMPIPDELLVVEAEDDDGSSDGDDLVFTVTSNPNTTAFTITNTSAKRASLTLDTQLDRETVAQAQYTLTVQVCDQGTPAKCDSVVLTVTITDYNDQNPEFTDVILSREISECTPGGSSLATVIAEDTADLGNAATVFYKLEAGDTGSFFLGEAGDIHLSVSGVDYEVPNDRILWVTVRAMDNPGDTPQLSSTTDANLTVTVTDCNDHPPVFIFTNTTSYRIIVAETPGLTSAKFDVLTTVDTTDADGTVENQAVTYSIVSNTFQWFEINPTSGVISVKTNVVVDRESDSLNLDSQGQGVFSFDILAVNEKPIGDVLGDSFTATATVAVTITDINDNKPVFVTPLMTTLPLSVAEHSPIDTILLVLQATDEDYGTNADVTYNITAGNGAGDFMLKIDNDANFAFLAIKGDLDTESSTSSYTLTITASNSMPLADGTPATDTVTVNIMVVGGNDFTPAFPQLMYTASIREFNALLPNGSLDLVVPNTPLPVASFSATDGDGDDLEYFITGGNELGIFDISNPELPQINIIRPENIDYESKTEFNLIVTVQDTVLTRRQNTTHILVTVVDQNDNFPEFLNTQYTGTVKEESPDGTEVIVTPTIQAMDVDELNGMESVTILFTMGNPALLFEFNTTDNTVITTTPVDREMSPLFTITAQAQDSAANAITTTLTIVIEDINDNPPVIQETPTELEVKLPEDFAVGDPVQTVTAVDEDIGENADFRWFLDGGLGRFDINRTTGVITLTDTLDIEEITEYDLTVTVSDLQFENSVLVKVTVINDTNDNNPIFEQSVYEGMIEEGLSNGTRVETNTGAHLTVKANDLDVTSDVTYTLAPGTTAPFDVDETNGEIYINGLLDREARGFYSFTVLGVDTVMGSIPASAIVEVTIIDANDELPMFTEDDYMKDVQEDTPPTVTILKVTATDNDIGTNAKIEYTITSVTPLMSFGVFLLDPDTGDVYTNPNMSGIEVTPGEPTQVILDIQAEDRGPGNNRDMARVLLNLIDRNNNGPKFEETNYKFSIDENVDGLVGQVNATDPGDLGANARVTYSILSGVGSAFFEINSTTGEITTNGALNREEEEFYTLNVAAQDNPTDGVPRSAFTTVDITVVDLNDNDPSFDPENYPIAISEKTAINSTVVQVKAFDVDSGTNAEITYTFLSGDTFAFKLDSSDGTIRTQQTFDYEDVKVYAFTVLAEDAGTPARRRGMANVTVTITDENDNNPKFVQNNTVVEIFEGLAEGEFVFQVNATDADDAFNKELAYTFENGLTRKDPFMIDIDSGVITTTQSLDRENIERHELTVIASDQRGRGPEVRQTVSLVTVIVLDVNDELPEFVGNRVTMVSILENRYDGSPAVIGAVPEANDDDINVNAELYYHILDEAGNSTDCVYAFCVGVNTGDIILIAEVDRETNDTYDFDVVVSNFPVWNESPRLEGLSPVTITITDVNDNPPDFIDDTLLAAIAEEASFGTTVTTLRVTDPDLGDGQVIVFSILTGGVPYVVDVDTGVMTSAGLFRGLSGTRHEVQVEARDNKGDDPYLAANDTMVLFVFKTAEQVIATFGRTKEEIEAKIDRIEMVLAEATGYRIIINDIRVHETESGSVDITQTDVVFFALNRVTGAVIEPDVVIQRVDSSYQVGTELYNLFQECRLVEVKAYPVTGSDDDLPAYVWAIVGIMAGLIVFVCCCLLCVFVIERRRNRYLRSKQNAASYQSQLDQFTSQDYNPVNNPLWVAPYDNWEETSTDATGTQLERDNPLYESQELTIEMFQDDGDIDETPAGSRSNLMMKAPPMSHSTPTGVVTKVKRESTYSGASDDELLAEAIGERKHPPYDYDSETSLI